MRFFCIFITSILISSCAYELGYKNRNLPGEHTEIDLPMFINETMIVGLETYFTNELKRQFYRSKIAKINKNAPIKIIGRVRRTYIDVGAKLTSEDSKKDKDSLEKLPKNTVLATSYNMTIDVKIQMIRRIDNKVLWQTDITDDLPYSGAQLKLEGVNSSNTLYNQSAISSNLKQLASIMMAEAHNRMTENF